MPTTVYFTIFEEVNQIYQQLLARLANETVWMPTLVFASFLRENCYISHVEELTAFLAFLKITEVGLLHSKYRG